MVWLYRAHIPCALGGHYYLPLRRLEEREGGANTLWHLFLKWLLSFAGSKYKLLFSWIIVSSKICSFCWCPEAKYGREPTPIYSCETSSLSDICMVLGDVPRKAKLLKEATHQQRIFRENPFKKFLFRRMCWERPSCRKSQHQHILEKHSFL